MADALKVQHICCCDFNACLHRHRTKLTSQQCLEGPEACCCAVAGQGQCRLLGW
jgi:hypothetical protein